MNRKAKKGQLSFYMLIHLLHEESLQVKLQVWLVSENKLIQRECQKYHKVQTDIFRAWDDYDSDRKTPS